MTRFWSAAMLVCAGMACGGEYRFEPPLRLMAGEKAVCVESPGWASPCLGDLDGDGKRELLVGQFSGGKIKVYRHLSGTRFGEGKWLQAGGSDVAIPGVW